MQEKAPEPLSGTSDPAPLPNEKVPEPPSELLLLLLSALSEKLREPYLLLGLPKEGEEDTDGDPMKGDGELLCVCGVSAS